MLNVGEKVTGGIVLAVVLATLWFNTPPAATLNGKDLIPPKNEFHLMRHGEEVDGTIKVTNVATGATFTADLASGQLYQTPDQHDSGAWKVQVQRDRYLIDPGLDLGVFAGGYLHGGNDEHRAAAVGIRVSPVRLLYGTVAPDLLATQDAAGVGISVYPPPDYFGHFWNHLGIGIGRLWDYHGGESDTVLYGSFSTRF